MMGFPGFPDGNLKATPLPDLFFSDLLPLVDDLIELKVTLHCLWLYRQKGGEVPYVAAAELEEDELLRRSLLAGAAREVLRYAQNDNLAAARDALREGLERAVGRGTLLQVTAQGPDGREQAWYLLNLGLIQSAMLAEELQDAERAYPPEWIEEAFRIAVANNVRRWAYVRRILERWAEEGRGPRGQTTSGRTSQDEADRERFTRGEYADYVEQ
jgi:DNA replication protein